MPRVLKNQKLSSTELPPKRRSATSKNVTKEPDLQPEPQIHNEAVPGAEDEPVYFWKPHEENGYLGQWYDSPWTHEGDTYETAEMWMMVGKARLFGDEVSTLLLSSKYEGCNFSFGV